MNQADRVRARLLQLITGASDDELFKINNTLAEAGHLDLDRCSKLGSPFPLFDLPLELLEHSAHYLSRGEAASMITVNRLFHDVFARVVWRSIKKSEIQPSALSRYGHLVNQLTINMVGFVVGSIASLVPNVMSVSIINDASGSNLQAGQLDLLRNLRKVIFCAYDLSENGSPLPIMLSHPWPSVASLKLVGYVKQDDHKYIASALPNLITLDYASNADSYDFADTLPKFKFLQVLTLRDDYSNPGTGQNSTIIMPNKVMNRLRSMKLREIALKANMVRFISCFGPNLVELKLGGCTLSREAVKYASKVSKKMKSPVRHLRLKAYIENQLDLWVEFISKFKNLKEIMVDNVCEGAYDHAKELAERFPRAKVELYQG
ncbi:hypothetical protein GQ42DRAFT_178328 [Ramicandelaber brevisporus]|nr:hypothetical protein GQ42DRAFT_178328 [Ramicandelaber brevisporus]